MNNLDKAKDGRALYRSSPASDGAADGVAEGLWYAVGDGERLCGRVGIRGGSRCDSGVEWVAEETGEEREKSQLGRHVEFPFKQHFWLRCRYHR